MRIRRTCRWSSASVPGARARIGAIEVQGAPREPAPQVLSALDLRVGDEYDGVDLDARLIRYANESESARVTTKRASRSFLDTSTAIRP